MKIKTKKQLAKKKIKTKKQLKPKQYLEVLRTEGRRGPRSPEELAELVEGLLSEALALEGPEPVGVVHLVPPPGHDGGHVPPCGVPFDVCHHEVLRTVHNLHKMVTINTSC